MTATLQMKCFVCEKTGAFRLPANPTWESEAECLSCGSLCRLLDLVYLEDNQVALNGVVPASDGRPAPADETGRGERRPGSPPRT